MLEINTQFGPIEKQAQTFSAAHQELRMIVSALQDELLAVKKQYLPRLRAAVTKTKERQATLEALVQGAPALFEKPRTQILHGIKVGFRKQKGGITWADADKVLKALAREFGDDAESYMHVRRSPDKEALNKLEAATLRRLGVEVHADQDKIVIEPVDGDVDKIVNALLADVADN